MGRITVQAKAGQNVQITVGWDRPLETYFATVLRPGEDEDMVLVWIGTAIGEITNAANVIAAIAPYAEPAADLRSRLEEDRGANAGKPDSPHQRAVKSLLLAREPR